MTVFTNQSKNSTSFANQSKNSTSFSNTSKNSTTFTNTSKSSTSFGNQDKSKIYDFLLLEDGGYLLQENGDKIILEQSTGILTWANATKN